MGLTLHRGKVDIGLVDLTASSFLLLLACILRQSNIIQAFFLIFLSFLGAGASVAINAGRELFALCIVPFGLLICASFIYVLSSWVPNVYYLLSELKILVIFFLPLFFVYLANLLFPSDPVAAINNFIRIAIRFLTCGYIITTALGVFLMGYARETFGFGHSINAAYAILYLLAYRFEIESIGWKFLAFLAIALLGSTTALGLALMVFISGSKVDVVKKWLIAIAGVAAFLLYSYEARDKNFITVDFSGFDRYQIYYYFLTAAGDSFQLGNYFFGFGLGREITGQIRGDFDHMIDWFLTEFAVDGVYSFSTHNDYLRLFFDFGFVGVTLVAYFLKKFVMPMVLICVSIAAFFNTTLFSTLEIVVISLIISVNVVPVIYCNVPRTG